MQQNSISKFIDAYQIEDRKGRKGAKSVSSENALNLIEDIYEEYAKTMDLWDVEMNLLSSNRLIATMRRKFEIENDLVQLNRNRNGIEQIYQGKQSNIQKRNSLLLAAVSLVITISTVVEVLQAALSEISTEWPQIYQDIIHKYLMMIIIGVAVIGVLGFFAYRKIMKDRDKNVIKKK